MNFHPKTRLVLNDFEITRENYHKIDLVSQFTESWNLGIVTFLHEFLNQSSQIEISTSGTTGVPKIMQIAKEKMVYSSLATGKYFDLKASDSALLSLSSTYIAAKMMIVRALTLGLTLHMVKPSSNPLLENNLPKEFDFAPFVPLQMQAMIQNEVSFEKLKGIKQIILGGSNVNCALWEDIKRLPNKVYETFGMTETLSHVAVRQINHLENSTDRFNALPGITFETDDRNCLLIHAPKLLNEKLVTNDVVELDSSVSFQWKGRFDHMINSGGIKIFPEMIEKQLETIIHTAYFVGSVPDVQLGEKVILIIEDLPNNLHLCTLYDQMKEILPKYHLPKEVFVVPMLDRNINGKILRQEILEKIAIDNNK